MRISNFLYDFGIAQDDPATELKALNLKPGDRVLCVASAGEVPLELLVNSEESIEIDAADISEQQLYLSNLKLQAAVELKSGDAARFLGYQRADPLSRKQWFDEIKVSLGKEEILFWMNNPVIFEKGPIQYGRYETYIARFAPFGRWLMGGSQKIMGLFDCTEIDQQKVYFDEVLKTGLLKILFKLIFHRRLYRNRGISDQGLMHMGDQNVGVRFFQKFRGFCTNTLARNNWYLQFMLFNRVMFEEALPGYLQPHTQKKLKAEHHRLKFIKKSYTDCVEEFPVGYYSKFAFSNISDWLTASEMMYLMDVIAGRAGPNAVGLIRYIYSSGLTPEALHERVQLDSVTGEQLLLEDRFPFYNLLPVNFTITASDNV
ncbi:DUF3419 family protein [Fodinibius sp.]|uniref:DUF3419 family protein n=1 Tax=Fodinibius sp. TaxID=1872440 RepID=UPI0035699089